jgi:hypothetical protein
MTRSLAGLLLFALVVATGWAAEPMHPRTAAEPVAVAVQSAKPEAAKSTQRPWVHLRITDVRRYMTPVEYEALTNPQADERNTVIVKADAPLVPMKSQLDVPGGIIAPFWALANPSQAWRIFAPITNFKDGPTENKVPIRSMGLGPLKPGE